MLYKKKVSLISFLSPHFSSVYRPYELLTLPPSLALSLHRRLFATLITYGLVYNRTASEGDELTTHTNAHLLPRRQPGIFT